MSMLSLCLTTYDKNTHSTVCTCTCVCVESLLKDIKDKNLQANNKTRGCLVTRHVAIATGAIWLTMFFFVFYTSAQNKFDFRPVSAGRSHLLYNRSSCPALVCLRVLTLVAPPVFDDNGPPAACLLLGLGHALTSLIVRVICSVDCHLLLNHPET